MNVTVYSVYLATKFVEKVVPWPKNYLILVTGLQILRSKNYRKNLKFPVFLSTKLSQLLCWVIFDKSYGLFSHLSAVEAIFGYENCRKSGPSAKKLSSNGH